MWISLQSGSALWNEKGPHIGLFQLQQFYLFMNSPGVARQTAVCAHNAVAGDDDGNFIATYWTAFRERDIFPGCFTL